MRWYRDICRILQGEPESWLAYLHGQQLSSLREQVTIEPRYRGVFLRLLVFLYELFRSLRIRRTPTGQEQGPDYLVYAGTVNQMSALDSTIDALRERGEGVLALAEPGILKTTEQKNRYEPLHIGPVDLLKALVLLAVRGFRLHGELKQTDTVAVDGHFNKFCNVYRYLPYFMTTLEKTRPGFVITSNDHNPANRCFLAAAHDLGISTVYMQHASVSDMFPALRVDYAFLDGQFALEAYVGCEGNQPEWRRNVPDPTVFLTGQKKCLHVDVAANRSFVGVSANVMDDVEDVIEMVKRITSAGWPVSFRWHPAQHFDQIAKYRQAFGEVRDLVFSDPGTEHVSGFLGRLKCLIAGNSSIHLEAALNDIVTIYYEVSPPNGEDPGLHDYYGYVKNGLAREAFNTGQLLESISSAQSDVNRASEESVRYYSATYHTRWQGREGELVAGLLGVAAAGAQQPGLSQEGGDAGTGLQAFSGGKLSEFVDTMVG